MRSVVVAWPNTIIERDLDQAARIIGAVALVLYLLPVVRQLKISPRIAHWMRITAISLVGAGIVAAAILSLIWYFG